MTRTIKPLPHRQMETALSDCGYKYVVGIDEVGKGAWAGPLVVGVAVIPVEIDIEGVRDSKQISEKRREEMFDSVAAWVTDWSIGVASNRECDEYGMSQAQRMATARALAGLKNKPDAAIVDGKWDFVTPYVGHVEMRVKADNESLSVAAASILAKVSRDRMMRTAAIDYPMWSFDTNKGYPCPKQRTALFGYGACAIHRVSWSFMDTLVPWGGRTTSGFRP